MTLRDKLLGTLVALGKGAIGKYFGSECATDIVRIWGGEKENVRIDALENAEKDRGLIEEATRIIRSDPEFQGEPEAVAEMVVAVSVARFVSETKLGSIATTTAKLPTPKTNAYILRLGPPLIEPKSYVHLSYKWNDGLDTFSYKVRDFTHNRIFFGGTEYRGKGRGDKDWVKELIDWRGRDLLAIWVAATDRISAWDDPHGVTEDIGYWRKRLAELDNQGK